MPSLRAGSRVSTREVPPRYGNVSEAVGTKQWKVVFDAGGEETLGSNALVSHRTQQAGRQPSSATKQAQSGSQTADETGVDALPEIEETPSSSSDDEEEEEEEPQVHHTLTCTVMAMHTHTNSPWSSGPNPNERGNVLHDRGR